MRLAPAGLRLIRTHGEGSVAPTSAHTGQRAAVEHTPAPTTPASLLDAYQAAHLVMTGAEVLPARLARSRKIVLGRIANLGIVNTRPRTPVLTDAAMEAFVS